VEEPVEGEALDAKFSGGRKMNVQGFLNFAYQVTEAVEQLHAAGSVHGNIRPENIYILPASKIKLANAGYPYVDPAGGQVLVPFPKEANREADLKSLGFLFYRCLTGRELDPALLGGDSPTPRLDLGEEVPAKVTQILEKTLSRGENARFASAGDLRKELGVALQRENPMAVLPGAAPPEEEPPPPPQGFLHRFSRTQIIVGAVVLAVLAVVLVMEVLALLGPRNRVDTPNLVDKNVEEARKEAESDGLEMVVTREEYRSDIKAGRVVSQNPPAGKRINEGDTISVVVSTGPLQVPNLSLLPVEDATALLRSRGLEVGDLYYEVTSEYRPGIVLDSDPPFGTEVSGGDRVDLVVSKSP
jgi:eukaryotic-like serine/threonine-protein kinase